MTITYPRALPSLRIAGCTFELDRVEFTSPEAGGQLTQMEMLAGAVWIAKYETTPPTEIEFDNWRAWTASLKGARRLFYGQDVRRRMPRAYRSGFADLTRAGGGAFDGTITAANWSVNTARDELTLGTLPVGFTLSKTDYVGFTGGVAQRTLHRFLETANASGGGSGTWTIEPPLPTWIHAAAVASVNAPTCLMAITPGSLRLEGDGKAGRSVAFEARQHIEDT